MIQFSCQEGGSKIEQIFVSFSEKLNFKKRYLIETIWSWGFKATLFADKEQIFLGKIDLL